MIVARYKHFYTEPRLALVGTLNDKPGSAVGFRLSEKEAKEYYAEVERHIKQIKQPETMVEYQITHAEFLVDGEVFASTKMATPARTSLLGASLLIDLGRELTQYLNNKAAVI